MSDSTKIDIEKIVIRKRSRDVNDDWANVLAAAFRDSEMLNPVTLWQDGEEAVLVAGLHRIAAHRINGESQIACRWVDAESLADAKIYETSENLLRHELTKLDRAQHLFDLKEQYEEKFPETKHGGDRGNQHTGGKERQDGIIPFWQNAADATGLSPSAITKAVAMIDGLSFDTIALVKGTWLANHQAGLMQLSPLKDHQQAKVLALIFPSEGKRPKATNVADAIFLLENKKLLTSVQKRFAGLNKSLKSLEAEEFNKLMSTNFERVAAWYEEHAGKVSS